MLYLVTGENQFSVDQALADLVRTADEVRHYDGALLSHEELTAAIFAVSMFASHRVVVIHELSKQKLLWEALPKIYQAVDQTDVVIYEPRPDKRLKTSKWLATAAQVIDCKHILGSDTSSAEAWLADYSRGQGVSLRQQQIADMVRRAIRTDANDKAIIDQQLLATTVLQLRDADNIDDDILDTVLSPSIYENVFSLLGSALDGDRRKVTEQVAHMRQGEESYMVLGLISTQLAQLIAIYLADENQSIDDIAKATATHPYALRSMKKFAAKLTLGQLKSIVQVFVDADEAIKTSSIDPWTALDIALMKVTLSTTR